MKIIKREVYINKIKKFIGKNLIKVITGQRRVGKSYILLQLIDYIKKNIKNSNIIYIDKEKFEFEFITDYKELYNYIEKKSSADKLNFIFIDEIQEIYKFEKAILDLYNRDNFDIFITGSNSNLFSKEIATRFSGRYIEFTIHALSYREFLKFHNLEKGKYSLNKYIKFGGLPYLIHLELQEDIVEEYIKSIYNTVILKDVIAKYNLRNVNFLDRLIKFIASNIGSIFSAKKISDFLKSQHVKLSVNTVLNYISYLTDVFLIHSVPKYDIKGKKIFEIYEKFYFEDLGIRNSIIHYNIKDFGKIIENLIYLHLIINDYKVYVGKFNDKEIDFVAIKGSNIIYIQACYLISNDNTLEREFGNLLKIPDNYRKIVVSTDEFIGNNYKGIEHINLIDFLYNFQ